MTEIDLLRACQQHDVRAQTALYNLYKTRLMGLCRRYARSQPEAEDMFHEGFIRIFQQLHTLEQSEKLLPWMKRVMVNTAINVYHKNHKQQAETDLDDAWMHASDDHLDTLSRLGNYELLELIEQLPDGYRLVFNLYVIDGYNHVQIAEMLQIAEGTSKSQLARAKNLLKQKLKTLGIYSYEEH
ncbi:RNA polymerase sigma factor [Rudanella lutea]|uniref:RNA polymerase sigma factor n=1 Tax=Rudanella lutea TaxID=451374 RepID=UPI0003707EC3|nr:RNA polymerase sigma factor [Rudanella lutea]